jgi:hypothetical protein
MMHEIRFVRNKWAHQKDITLPDLLRFVDSIKISLELLEIQSTHPFYADIDCLYYEIIEKLLITKSNLTQQQQQQPN